MDVTEKSPGRKKAPADSRAYLRLAETLKERILDGSFPCGEKIPSEATLSKEHGLALMTVRQAVGVLVEHGLLERVPGRGTYVKELSWSGAPFFIDGLVEAVRARQTRVDIIRSEVLRANQTVATQLGIELGDSVIFLRRHIMGEEGVLLVQEGYLLLDPRRPVVEAELEATYITGLFTGSGQGLIKRAVLSIAPTLMSDEDARTLGRPQGSVGFRLSYAFFDAALGPLAVGWFIAPEDQLKLTAQIGIN
ncbi:MAG: GntR family transcriptional regulator [Candidatus Adiutrix sp.]|jgi:GntR family transcriptional regulator|nr:GntR family transcriptional regulator [Candidatus Adiutrix sp.]